MVLPFSRIQLIQPGAGTGGQGWVGVVMIDGNQARSLDDILSSTAARGFPDASARLREGSAQSAAFGE